MKINSILIANRGEIACRIIRTANEMGIKTIAVYEEADSNATFVSMSDVAVKLKNGYLDADEIVDAAKKTGADAIHPGYGFLSENSIFARKVIRNNIIWIGPTPHVIKVMGDKIKAKELAIKANVPTLEKAESIKDSKQLGFPLLIKAAAEASGGAERSLFIGRDYSLEREAFGKKIGSFQSIAHYLADELVSEVEVDSDDAPVSVDVAVPELVSPDKEEVNTISTVDNSESTIPDNVNEVD